jgi:two-component system nitrate/nitrite response regulator NarL
MTEGSKYSVLIIDDHPLFRRGVGQLLAMDEQFELAAEAASGQEGVDLVRRLQPDLVLLDLNMKAMNGIQTLKAIKQLDSDSLVVMLTVSNAEDDLVAALRTGADGYLLKDMEPEELLVKLKRAAKGQVVLDEALTGLLAHAIREDTRASTPESASLTERELEILTLISAGMSNKLIARELEISDGTVKVHVKHLLRKLNLNSRLEAAVWAHEHGLKS